MKTIVNRPAAMPDLKPEVPEVMENLSRERLNGLRRLGPKQEHQIDVGVWSQLSATIPPERNNATMLRARRLRFSLYLSDRIPVAAGRFTIVFI